MSSAAPDLPAASVQLQFKGVLREAEYKLLEVSEAMLQEISRSSFDFCARTGVGLVELRGSASDDAALVTASKTYSVRLVESSNTQMLVNATSDRMFERQANTVDPTLLKKQKTSDAAAAADSADSAAAASAASSSSASSAIPVRIIEGLVQHHYEVTEILPRLHVLRDLLMARLYGEADENDDEADESKEDAEEDIDMTTTAAPTPASRAGKGAYTLPALRRLIQASDAQLLDGLARIDAFEDPRTRRWRMLNPDYTAKVLDSLLNFFVEKQWKGYANLDAEECGEGLKELFPAFVTKHVLKMHSRPIEAGKDANLFTLDPAKVCLFHAVQLFALRQPYPHLQFLEDWQARVPEGMAVDAALLRGHALCESAVHLEAMARSTSSAAAKPSEEASLQWRYFPVSSLSPLVKTRFTQLFTARSKWKLNDIQCYTEELCTPGQTLEQLLLKQTRPITVMENGAKLIVYTKR